jgi:hypothetical protein
MAHKPRYRGSVVGSPVLSTALEVDLPGRPCPLRRLRGTPRRARDFARYVLLDETTSALYADW